MKRPGNGMLIELSKKPVGGAGEEKEKEKRKKGPDRPAAVHLFIRGSWPKAARSNELSPCDTRVTCGPFF